MMGNGAVMNIDNRIFCSSRSWVSHHSRNQGLCLLRKDPFFVHYGNLCKASQRTALVSFASTEISQSQYVGAKYPIQQFNQKKPSWRVFATSINLEEEPSVLLPKESFLSENNELNQDNSSERPDTQLRDSSELKSLLADSERSKLVRKLSEANQHNRFLKRELQSREDTLINFKSELAILELELQTLVGLAEEVAKSGIYKGSKKINGKYVPSHLLSRLEVIHEKVKKQIKGVHAIKVREIELFWYGMAEIVQVMGSFDGWSQGEQMSPEYTGGFNKFSTVLKVRPGRYEIKFLVDGQWQLSPELPTVGEGLMQNNLLVVE